MQPKRPVAKIASFAVVAGVLVLIVVIWQHLGVSGGRLQQPTTAGTAQESLLNETAISSAAAKAHATHKAHSKPHKGLGRQVDSGNPDSFQDPYACDGDCPPGYDVFNTTGTEAEARWLHAAGFPTPGEYESMTRDEAAVADARRRALAGDSWAAGILAAYYLEQKDYSETLTMATLSKTTCNVYALRVDAQRVIDRAQEGGEVMTAAMDLQVAYLLGDQEAASELASLIKAAHFDEVIESFTRLVIRGAASRLEGYRENNRRACQQRGLRPTAR